MIQGVVNRLAQSSFLLKGWSVVLVSALLALAAGIENELVLYVALLPVLAFWGLDGYFLWQERLFRALYDHVRAQSDSQLDYAMDTGLVPDRVDLEWGYAVLSRTLWLFHGALLVTVVVVLLVMS